MDVTTPSSMQRFMIRVGLAKKKKVQRQSSLRPRSRSTSKSGTSESDPSSQPSANVSEQNLTRTPQPKRAQTFFGTLTNKLRVRSPATRRTLDGTPGNGRAALQKALRSRGLLPPRPRVLSAIEAEEDSHIAQSWRSGNSMWLSLGPMTPVNLVPEVLISPIDESSDCLKLLAEEANLATSGPLDGSSVSDPLPSDARLSPVPSLRTASPGVSDELTGLAQHSVIDSPCSLENLSVGKSQTDIVRDVEKQSSQSTPTSPSLRKELRVLSAFSSLRPASPSCRSENFPAPCSPRLPPSPRSLPSPRPAPSGPLPSPPDLFAPPQITVPDASQLLLCASEVDTLVASPTSPTVPSLRCSSSSEMSHSTVFTDNGENLASPASYTMPTKGRRANLSPIAVKSSDGGFLCEEIIIETTESFPEDDLDPFAVDVISKSASIANLRRSMTSAFQTRARPCSPLSPVDQSPPLSPISVTMHNSASILAQASLIHDDETRRLSELAFM
ncbi:hypothetical protein EI94DRAFT_1716481 [Lactarius quietus]|nr:hypothetical protein EI94DRAFT_1716481 [Lactarius quietus]